MAFLGSPARLQTALQFQKVPESPPGGGGTLFCESDIAGYPSLELRLVRVLCCYILLCSSKRQSVGGTSSVHAMQWVSDEGCAAGEVQSTRDAVGLRTRAVIGQGAEHA